MAKCIIQLMSSLETIWSLPVKVPDVSTPSSWHNVVCGKLTARVFELLRAPAVYPPRWNHTRAPHYWQPAGNPSASAPVSEEAGRNDWPTRPKLHVAFAASIHKMAHLTACSTRFCRPDFRTRSIMTTRPSSSINFFCQDKPIPVPVNIQQQYPEANRTEVCGQPWAVPMTKHKAVWLQHSIFPLTLPGTSVEPYKLNLYRKIENTGSRRNPVGL